MEKIITIDTHTVTIRPLPYDTWLELEEERDELLDASQTVDAENLHKAQATLNRFTRRREQLELAACVVGWESLKPSLSILDVRLLKDEVKKLSSPELEAENLPAAAAGAAVPTA